MPDSAEKQAIKKDLLNGASFKAVGSRLLPAAANKAGPLPILKMVPTTQRLAPITSANGRSVFQFLHAPNRPAVPPQSEVTLTRTTHLGLSHASRSVCIKQTNLANHLSCPLLPLNGPFVWDAETEWHRSA